MLLSNTKISDLQEKTVISSGNLFSKNKIIINDKSIFPNNIRKLDLSNNKLKTIDGFKNLASLQKLDLHKNYIKILNTINLPKSLIELNLNENPIATFSGTLNLQKLYLNNLSKIEKEKIVQQFPGIEIIF